MGTKIRKAIGIGTAAIDVFPAPILAQRAPNTTDVDYPMAQIWVDESSSPVVIYFHDGGGTWNPGGNDIATTTTYGIVKLDDDLTDGATADTVPTSEAAKDYIDGIAIAGAPVATEAVQGIGELATNAEAVARTPSTGLKALLLTPTNLDSILAAPSAIGGTTPDAGTFTDLTADGTGQVSLGSNAAGDFTVTGASTDLTLESSGGSVNILASEAAATAVRIDASDAAGGIDVDAGTAGFIVDTTGAISLDSAAASNFTVTGAFDLTLNTTAGSLNLSAGESAADSIVMESSAGGIQILASGAAAGEDIVVTATGSSILLTSTEGVANAISLQASSGGIDADAAGQINIASSQNAADAIVITSSAGGVDITATGTAGEDLDLLASGSSVNITATEDAAQTIYIHANGGTSETIDIHADQGTGAASINVHSDVGGVTLDSGLASADAININASNAGGGLDIDAGTAGIIADTTGAISLDSAAASNFTVTGAFDLTLNSTAGSVLINGGEAAADAINIDASNAAGGIDVDAGTGGVAIDSTGALSLDGAAASNFTVTGAGIDLTLSSAAGRVVVNGEEAAADAVRILSAAGGLDTDVALQLSLVSSQAAAADSVRIQASAADGGIDIDAGTGGLTLDSTGAISIDAAGASNLATSSGDLTIDSSAGSLILASGESAADSIQILSDNGGIDITAASAAAGEDIDITATGSSINITTTENVSDALVLNASGAASGASIDAGTAGLTIGTGLIVPITSIVFGDTPYSVLGTDYLIAVDTGAGAVTVTLPAAPETGRSYVVYDAGGAAAGANITIAGNGNNISFAGVAGASATLNTAYESAVLYFDGSLWLARDVV